jgi:hypothetical protein
MNQRKIVQFPVLYPYRMHELSFELLDQMIELIQQGKKLATVTLEMEKKENPFTNLTTTTPAPATGGKG